MTESGGRSTPEQPEQPEHDADFEAQFAQLVKDVEQGRKAAAEEPSARARMLASKWREQPPPSTPWRGDAPSFGHAAAEPERPEWPERRRVWPRNLAIAIIVGAVAVGVVQTMRQKDAHGTSPAANANRNANADSTPSASPRGTASATGAASGTVSQIPVSQLFPQTVHGTNGAVYTLVTAGGLNNCVNSDMVAPTLAGLFAQSNGCIGGEGALYKDAAKDQFNMTIFTLKDPADVVSIVTDLTMDPSDFEVGALQPPAGSGLTALSASSGIIQQFAGSGHYLGVFMAQWSDGHASDYASLQKLLDPLQTAVSTTMNRTH
ncbi:hypothetical protein [Actinospica sp.]|uniref:hypothetical protein n=1 Tax=Actinospica sp. TaxID=1872142 RepID=UPI002BA579B5|nr:hypothetical protein [Actinospica sp.]HWG26655.1 hypothetical protein [Actinospica sp.]